MQLPTPAIRLRFVSGPLLAFPPRWATAEQAGFLSTSGFPFSPTPFTKRT